MSKSFSDLQDSFIEWLLLPEFQRGDIESEAEWGRRHGVSVRTVRRWKSSERAVERLSAPREGLSGVQVHPEPVSDVDGGYVGGDESDYRIVKSALISGAKSGNPKYLDLYFKTYGKPFVEEEVAARSTDLAGLDMDVLVSQTLAVLSIEAVVSFLQGCGWTVFKNGDSDSRFE